MNQCLKSKLNLAIYQRRIFYIFVAMDNFIVSARKYRPVTFESVVGQRHITSTLKNAILNKQLAQAFLFCGPRGVGKTTCARILAKTINCQNILISAEACDECASCVSFKNGNSFSIHELDAASNNSVDDIRTLNEQVRIPPQSGNYKIYIIDEVHMLSQAAFNAFLKTLEEPPSYAIFILATTEKHKILPTILSRCQIFDFNRIKVEDIASHLEQIALKENVSYNSDALHLIAQKADGGLRDALSIFDQMVNYSNKNLSYQAVIDNLNILDYDYYFRISEAITQENPSEVLLTFDLVLNKGFDGSHFIAGLSDHFRNLLVVKDIETVRLLEVSQGIKDRYLQQSTAMSSGFLLSALNIANQCELNLKSSRNQRLQIELALLKMCHIGAAIMMSENMPSEQLQAYEGKKKAINKPIKSSSDSENPIEKREQSPEHIKTTSSLVIEKDAQKKESNKDDRKGKISIPKLKDINLSSSIPSLGSVFENTTNRKSEEEPTYIEGIERNSFSETEFLKQWASYAESVKRQNKINLYTLMVSNQPKILENAQIEVIVENAIQSHLLLNEKVEILNYLRPALQNYQIDLVPLVQTNTVIRKPITDAEKYQAMLAKNPLLDQLRQTFNLGFE